MPNCRQPSLSEKEGLKLPFHSANYGKRPDRADGQEWSFANQNAPLGNKRSSSDYGKEMFKHLGAAGGGGASSSTST